MWFRYKNNRWEEIDSGTTLRLAISKSLRTLYNQKGSNSMADVAAIPVEKAIDLEKDADFEKNRSLKILAISNRLANTNDKKNIMTEAKELFYDGSFLEKMDTNPYLLCFNNGVIDFREKCFRKGQPEDIISLCTNIDYVPLNPSKHKKLMDEINDFMIATQFHDSSIISSSFMLYE
jgi:phage/plasmid-associated DNA primase